MSEVAYELRFFVEGCFIWMTDNEKLLKQAEVAFFVWFEYDWAFPSMQTVSNLSRIGNYKMQQS